MQRAQKQGWVEWYFKTLFCQNLMGPGDYSPVGLALFSIMIVVGIVHTFMAILFLPIILENCTVIHHYDNITYVACKEGFDKSKLLPNFKYETTERHIVYYKGVDTNRRLVGEMKFPSLVMPKFCYSVEPEPPFTHPFRYMHVCTKSSAFAPSPHFTRWPGNVVYVDELKSECSLQDFLRTKDEVDCCVFNPVNQKYFCPAANEIMQDLIWAPLGDNRFLIRENRQSKWIEIKTIEI